MLKKKQLLSSTSSTVITKRKRKDTKTKTKTKTTQAYKSQMKRIQTNEQDTIYNKTNCQ